MINVLISLGDHSGMSETAKREPSIQGGATPIGAALAALRPAAVLARSGFPFALAAIALAALAIQVKLGVCTESLWLMLLCDRLLDGQTAYVDFLENSPPFAILIYMPPVAAARLIGVAREPMLIAYIFALVGASLAVCGGLLARAGRLGEVGRAGALAAVAGLLLLPNYQAFGQRDHIALILVLPWLTVMTLRVDGVRPSRFGALAAGLTAGAIFAVRPHYALSFAGVVAFVAWRRGFRALLGCAEFNGAVASAILSVAASLAFFPNYFTRMLPIVADLYVPVQHASSLLLVQPASIAWLSMLAALVALRDRLQTSPMAITAALASVGAFLAYLMQGKGYPYHCYVAVVLMVFAFVMVSAKRMASPPTALLASLCFALVWFCDIEPGHVDLQWPLGALTLAGLVSALTFSRIAMRIGAQLIHSGVVCIAFASLGSSSLAFHSGWFETPPFLAEVSRLGPRPRIAMISPVSEFAYPLISRVRGVWVQSVFGLLITNDAASALAHLPSDLKTRQRLESYRRLDQTRFLADVSRTSPDAVIVDETWVAASNFEDQPIKAWLSDYRVMASLSSVSATGETHVLSLYARAPAVPSPNG